MKESYCRYMFNEICVNDKCPMCADYCPVPDIPDVCKWDEREEIAKELQDRDKSNRGTENTD